MEEGVIQGLMCYQRQANDEGVHEPLAIAKQQSKVSETIKRAINQRDVDSQQAVEKKETTWTAHKNKLIAHDRRLVVNIAT